MNLYPIRWVLVNQINEAIYIDPSAEQDIESVCGSNSGQSGCKTGTRPVCKYNNRVIRLKMLENKASKSSGKRPLRPSNSDPAAD